MGEEETEKKKKICIGFVGMFCLNISSGAFGKPKRIVENRELGDCCIGIHDQPN